jgi:methylated-DNA-[protein]-cysteine S-methyltransferase
MSFAQQILDTPLGWMVVKGDEESIHQAFWVSEDELIIGHGTAPAAWKKEVQTQVNEYFKKERNQFNLPLSPQGTEFQKMVWAQIRSIPFGTTKYYCDVLRGDHTQAVGGTTGANPILLLIPCHRLIRSDGDLTGYSGGLDRKEKLLELEGAHLAQQLSLF